MDVPVILVVDDDEDMRKILVKFLLEKQGGHDIVMCEDGQSAWYKITKECGWKTDLVITDLEMPRMNGQELTKKVKKIYPGIKIIMISGIGETLSSLAKEAGADAFLKKPFKLEQLRMVAQELL